VKIEDVIQLKDGEEVLSIVHEDIFPHVPKFILLFLWVVVPFFFLFPLFRLGAIGVLIFFVLLVAALAVSYRTYVMWSHTLMVVTDRRVIDIEQRGLFERAVTEAPFTRIEEVTYRIKGIIPTILRYGELRVKVAGSAADIDFRRVRGPGKIQDLINDLCATARKEERDDRETKLRQLAKNLSPEQLDEMLSQVRKREREEAAEEFFNPSA